MLDAVLVEWTKRVGPDAARHRVYCYRTYMRAWLSGLVGAALLIAGGIGDITPLMVVGGATLLAWLLLTVRALIEISRMNRAIHASLRVHFGFFGGPPSSRGKYLAWCQRNGLEPYPYKTTDPPEVVTRWL